MQPHDPLSMARGSTWLWRRTTQDPKELPREWLRGTSAESYEGAVNKVVHTGENTTKKLSSKTEKTVHPIIPQMLVCSCIFASSLQSHFLALELISHESAGCDLIGVFNRRSALLRMRDHPTFQARKDERAQHASPPPLGQLATI